MEWARFLGLKALFITLDIEKSYDFMEWIFSLAMFQALGFDYIFFSRMETLFGDALASLYVNYAKRKEVHLLWPLRQHFPLALTSYVLVT